MKKSNLLKKSLLATSMVALLGVSGFAMADGTPTNGTDSAVIPLSVNVNTACYLGIYGDPIDLGTVDSLEKEDGGITFGGGRGVNFSFNIYCNQENLPFTISITNADPTDGHIELIDSNGSDGKIWVTVFGNSDMDYNNPVGNGSLAYSESYDGGESGGMSFEWFASFSTPGSQNGDSDALPAGSYNSEIDLQLNY